MLEKFIQNNKAENIRKWLDTVDLSSADILKVERDIYAALVQGQKTQNWLATPIAPLAEPVDLNALVGDLFTGANKETYYQAARLDTFYTWLSETNNVLKAELESVEKAVMQATDDIQDISIVIGDENRNFYWVSDSFNNSIFVDRKETTCLVDTDYGMVTLGPLELTAITNFDPVIDREVTNGIPGANLYILNTGKRGQTKEPEPILENTDTRNFGSLFDLSPSTWFEVERNFIPPVQKVKMEFGRAYTYSESGEEKNVKEITANLDWRAVIEWPDGWVDTGTDGKGIELVEWRNLDIESSVLGNSNSALSNANNPNVRLAFDLVLKESTTLSAIKLLPFTREDSSPIKVESIEVIADGNSILVAKDMELGTNRSTSRLQREILRRTGVQITGSLYSIPTDRNISKVRIVLSSAPAPTKNGFAHIFQDVLTSYRTERQHVFWRSVNKWKQWGRVPYSQNVPKVTSSNSRPAIVGSLMNTATAVYTAGKAFTEGSAALVAAGGKAIGGTLGAVGTWLGKAVPVIGAILALDQLVGGFFSINKSSAVEEARVGYDIFKGHRAAIGLRDITLVKTIYEPQSLIQSIKREFPGSVTKIGLFVDEEIPEHWGPGDWITYFVSTDGVNWSSIPKLIDSTLDKSLSLTEPTRTVYFRAILKGNPGDPGHSPKLKHYSLQGLPAS